MLMTLPFSILSVDDPVTSSLKLNNDLTEIEHWARKWLVTINPTKTECMTSVKRIKPPHLDLFYGDQKIVEVSQHTHLGVVLFNNLSWRAHIFKIYDKASKRLNMLIGIKFKVDRTILRKLYKSLVCPLIEYADVLWDGCTESESDLLEHVQYEAAKTVTGAMKGTSKHRLMQEIGWEDLKTRRAIHKLLYSKIIHNLCPSYLADLLPLQVSERTSYSLRMASNYSLFASRYERFKRMILFPSAATLWNDISFDIRCLQSIGPFKKALFSFFNVPSYNVIYNFAIDRFNVMIHTRLGLDTCALNYYLLKIGCRERPARFCGFLSETVKHFFLNVHFILPLELLCSPLLLTYLLTGGLLCLNHKLYPFFLFGSPLLSLEQNNDLFFHVQSFISELMRFLRNT